MLQLDILKLIRNASALAAANAMHVLQSSWIQRTNMRKLHIDLQLAINIHCNSQTVCDSHSKSQVSERKDRRQRAV
jgi:hypothetical protein